MLTLSERAPVPVALGLALLLLALVSVARAAEPNYPALTGRVVDEAGVLSASTRSGLTEMLAQHERSSAGQQVVVVTLKSLQGLSIEDFGYQLGRHWGIGQKDKNTGALLIVAPTERKVRIEVGYGLEDTLTDALSRTIIERDIVPAFKRGDLNGGVLAGTSAIIRVLGGNPGAATPAPAAAWNRPEFKSFGPFAGILIGLSPFLFLLFPLLLVLPFIIIIALMARSHGSGSTSHGYYSSGGSSSSGSSGGGGGGFSGGGGSFGGGGASGSW
jgi:uncharacterized protein